MGILIFFWFYSQYLVVRPEGFLGENIIVFGVNVVLVLYILFYPQCVRIQPAS